MIRFLFGILKFFALVVILVSGLILLGLRSDSFVERTVPWVVNLWLAHQPGANALRVTRLRAGAAGPCLASPVHGGRI